MKECACGARDAHPRRLPCEERSARKTKSQPGKCPKVPVIAICGGRMAITSAQSADTFIVNCALCIMQGIKQYIAN